MDIKILAPKLYSQITKYRYAALVLVIGVALLLIPGKKTQKILPNQEEPKTENSLMIDQEALTEILQSIQGAGKVQVLLSVASGEKTVYQTDSDTAASGDSNSIRIETVIVTDSQRNETGLISQINPPVYLGAIVVCQGADSAAVKLAVTQAVSKITGLGADNICVLKMK